MQIDIAIKSIVPMSAEAIHAVLQGITLEDCQQLAQMKVDEDIWWNEILSAFRPD